MRSFDLEVGARNEAAKRLYRSAGFRVTAQEGDQLKMLCVLLAVTLPAQPTPIEEHPRLVAALDLDINLRVKRDDLYPMAGGGIKARKIRYILRDAIAAGHDAIVTTGGPQSNHARAAAVLAAQLGIRCHLVIVLEPGVTYLDTGNILLMRLSGATIEYCRKEQLSERMDGAMALLRKRSHKPLYIYCLAGTVAFVEAAAEAQAQCGAWRPDFMIAASATGSTQAGFAIGYAASPTRVTGISVAREAERGGRIVRECIDEYLERARSAAATPPQVQVEFRDEWTDGGYERTSPQLLEVVSRAAEAGLYVDPTYSGKALRGLVELIRRGEIAPGSRVLFWHTGGLMNLQASAFAGGAIRL